MSYYNDYDGLRLENDSLRRELEDIRYRELREREERQRKWEEEERQHEQEWREAQRTANSWPEAFAKQQNLIADELALYPDQSEDTWFTDWLEEVKRAAEIYNEEHAKVQQQIKALRQNLREAVIVRLLEEFSDSNMIDELVRALKSNDPNWWLEW